MLSRGDMDGMGGIAVLGGGVGEHVALEAGGAEPLLQHIEDRDQKLSRRPRSAFDRPLEPLAEALVAKPEDREDQILLGPEMLVKSHLGDAGCSKDAIDAGRMEPVPVEKLQRGLHKMVPAARRHASSFLRMQFFHRTRGEEQGWRAHRS
jgi:hypothetical protein